MTLHEIVIKTVAKEFHVSEEDILTGVMKHKVCDARNAAIYMIRLKDQQHTQIDIGRFLNIKGNPYSFFKHARTKVDNLLKTDREFKLRFELCMYLIKNH